MKLRQLESLLEDVAVFEAPKIALEQFPTSAQLAARIVHVAHGLGDVEGRVVLDLGCGGGVLAIAAVLLGAQHVVSLAMTCYDMRFRSRAACAARAPDSFALFC